MRRLHRHRHAAVDIERVAVDERRGVGRQEHSRADQFPDLAPAAGRCALLQPDVELGVLEQRRVQFGAEEARRDRVDLEAVPRPVSAHACA